MIDLFNTKQWLIISPHADDAELGCGGIIARAKQEGIKVHVAVAVVKGEWHTRTREYVSSHQRLDELTASMNSVGVDFSVFNAIHDNEEFDLSSSSKHKLVSDIDALIYDISPDVIFIPLPSFHQEHKLVYDCCLAATRPTKSNSNNIKLIAAYEYPPAGWGESSSFLSNNGKLYINITEQMQSKIRLLDKYRTQLSEAPNSLISIDGVKRLASFRGLESGYNFAELFYILRMRVT